jgi:rod shape-determining protein MreC
MEFLLNRFRNLTALLLAILAQLVLLAYQVKSNGEVRLIRVWAVTAVTPLARVIEAGRGSVSRFFSDYFVLLDVREENKRLKRDLDRISMENREMRTELGTADRAGALAIFQQHSPSKTVAAHIIMNTADSSAAVVVVDRGSSSGVQKGMAVETPAGIVGKVVNVYPNASMVLEITHPNFAAGVISQKSRVHGTLKGQGRALVMVDDVQNEQNIDQDEWFYTSGEDGIFPKGLLAGQVATVRAGKSRKEIYVTPTGFQNGLEEVLIIIEGVHAPIPGTPALNQPVYMLAPPLDSTVMPAPSPSNSQPGAVSDADRVIDHYRKVGEVARHVYGDRGSGAPDYNINVGTKSPETERSASTVNPAPATQSPPRPGAPKTRNP